jgi:hypothetical protein
MRLLELFSGTGSVGRGFAAHGWEALSLDLDPRAPATIHVDILDWDYTEFFPGHFDCIWASPPCTEYSIARTTAKTPRNLDLADSLVKRTLELIAYFRPSCWWMENPYTGLMRKREVVAGLPFAKVDYCAYGSLYKKRTALWGNVPFEGRLCNKACAGWDGRGHIAVAQRLGSRSGQPGQALATLHALPDALVEAIQAATALHLAALVVPPQTIREDGTNEEDNGEALTLERLDPVRLMSIEGEPHALLSDAAPVVEAQRTTFEVAQEHEQ